MQPYHLDALELARGLPPTPANLTRVSKEVPEDVARWAFEQWELRRRAKVKFTDAEDLLFIREALEQASHEKIAEYHASLFPKGAPVIDMTTGIGADLLALARRGPTTGYELDPERANIARHNIVASNLEAEVKVEDSLVWLAKAGPDAYAFVDPARRVAGRRTLEPEEFSPNPTLVALGFARIRLGVMKLTPMLPDLILNTLGTGIRFISFGGECREVLAISGTEATPDRGAVHLESGEFLPTSTGGEVLEGPKGYLFDADPAAVRAHGLGSLIAQHGLSHVGDSNGYLTGDELIVSPWLRAYKVHYAGKADIKATIKGLRDLQGSVCEVKVRGAAVDGPALMRKFRAQGNPFSLVVWPVGRSLRHALVEPVV